MGRTHATSGAAVWLAGCAAVTAFGVHLHGVTVVVGAGVCAGMALLPDLDHPQSLASRTFGPVSQALAKLTAAGSRAVYRSTRARGDEPDCGTGHRTLLHTAPFAVLVGALVSLACGLGGRWGGGATMFAATGLALRGLLSARERRRSGAWIAVASLAAAVGCAWLPGASWWWIGVPAGAGCLVHCLGDAMTLSGCPILWPLPVAGRRWYPIGLPRIMRLRTGGTVEKALAVPLLVLAALLSGWYSLGG